MTNNNFEELPIDMRPDMDEYLNGILNQSRYAQLPAVGFERDRALTKIARIAETIKHELDVSSDDAVKKAADIYLDIK